MSSKIRMIALATAMLAGFAGIASAQEKKSLIVAEPTHGTGYLPLYVAIQKGFFAEENLDVKILTVDSGAGHTNAVLSGQAFAFIGGPEHNAFAKVKGGELRAVVNVVDRGNVYYVAKKGLAPKAGESMASFFKGKSIAVSFFGGTPNSITHYLLRQWKMDPKTDVTMKEMANGAVLAAVKAGAAEIGVTTEPALTRGIVEGIWSDPIINIPKDLGPYAYSTLNVRQASIKSEPDVVARFVRGVVKGLKFTDTHHEEALAVAKKEFPTMSLEDLKATIDRSFADEMWSKDGTISTKAWDTAEAVVLGATILKQPVPYDDIIDMQFVKATLAAK
ncbi:ABC transporter substrate-binding protein [Roseiarcaceae bacterium H3SJ34-1]|uniref:ABC transporter substrate-binding protein n=1 Tax=Terripilifer ovatus TaxID=3032367 RepID=UPI003AB95A4B|nr:ABC transporter substrate-binding protein [Roseiarcaceae bacterium H3SJ34-1]